MVRGHAQAQEFDAQARGFFHQRRYTRQPGAAEDVQVAELAREHADLMLVLTGQHGKEELVARMAADQSFVTARRTPGINASGRFISSHCGSTEPSSSWAAVVLPG